MAAPHYKVSWDKYIGKSLLIFAEKLFLLCLKNKFQLNLSFQRNIAKINCCLFLNFRIFGDELKLLWLDENKELQQLVKVKEPKVRGLRWFSIGSKSTLAHWMVNCNAKGEAKHN
jgi:hypothetical protein